MNWQSSLGCVAAVGMCSLLGATQAAKQLGAYQHGTLGFSITPPAFKTSSEAPSWVLAAFSAPPSSGFASNLNIQLQRMTLAEFERRSEAQFKTTAFQVVSKTERQVEKHAALEYVYSGTVQGKKLKYICLAIEDGSRVFLLTGTALENDFDDVEAAFKRSLSSFALDH